MKWEVKMYVGGTVFTESVHAVNREDAVDTAKNRNPHARIIGVNPKPSGGGRLNCHSSITHYYYEKSITQLYY